MAFPIEQDARDYEVVAAGQTAQVLGAVGKKGDTIESILVVPETTGPGQVLLLDGATSITVFFGGTTTVQPWTTWLNLRSVSGPWSITTGANVHVIASGKFA